MEWNGVQWNGMEYNGKAWRPLGDALVMLETVMQKIFYAVAQMEITKAQKLKKHNVLFPKL